MYWFVLIDISFKNTTISSPPPGGWVDAMQAETWGDQIRAYEREKRYVVDAGFVSGQPLRLQPGMFQAQDRWFVDIWNWME